MSQTYRSADGQARITRDDPPFSASLPYKIVIRGTVRAYRGTFYQAVLYARACGYTIRQSKEES